MPLNLKKAAARFLALRLHSFTTRRLTRLSAERATLRHCRRIYHAIHFAGFSSHNTEPQAGCSTCDFSHYELFAVLASYNWRLWSRIRRWRWRRMFAHQYQTSVARLRDGLRHERIDERLHPIFFVGNYPRNTLLAASLINVERRTVARMIRPHVPT
jgi:hypothetical protein